MLTRKRWTPPNYTGNAATDYANLTKSISDYLLSLEAKGSLTIGEAEINANQGIKFPATQVTSSDANTLDDYEEGTWTPTITSGTGSFTTVSATGAYTKIGREVTFYAAITITTNGTAATDVRMTLPFTSTAVAPLSGYETAAGIVLGGYVNGSNSFIYKYDTTYPGASGRVLYVSGSFYI